MATFTPPPPGPVQDQQGHVYPAWDAWFRQALYYAVSSAIPRSIPVVSTTAPLMDGVAQAGSSGKWSDGSHRHPTDTSRAAVSALPVASASTPLMDGVAAVGAEGKWSDGLHVHPQDQFIDKYRWEDLRMESSVKLAGVNDPALSVFRGGLRAWAFANGATVKEIFLQGQLSHSYLEGSDIKLHVHWGHISAADDGAVVWQAEWAWTNIGDAMGAPTTTTATAVNVLGADQYKHQMSSILTMTGIGKTISSMLTIRLFRDPTAGGDTSTADAYLFEVDAHYQYDHAGSVNETSKI